MPGTKRMRPGLLVLFAVALLSSNGCNHATGNLSGAVSFGGHPLDEGLIRLRPIGSGHEGGGQAKIAAGKYEIRDLAPGEYRVWIMAERKTGRQVGQPDVEAGKSRVVEEEIVQIIPVQYNVRSKLVTKLAAGENQQDFDLVE